MFRKFNQIFVLEVGMSDRWNELNKRIQVRGEPLIEYFYDKVRLDQSLNLHISEQLSKDMM